MTTFYYTKSIDFDNSAAIAAVYYDKVTKRSAVKFIESPLFYAYDGKELYKLLKDSDSAGTAYRQFIRDYSLRSTYFDAVGPRNADKFFNDKTSPVENHKKFTVSFYTENDLSIDVDTLSDALQFIEGAFSIVGDALLVEITRE